RNRRPAHARSAHAGQWRGAPALEYEQPDLRLLLDHRDAIHRMHARTGPHYFDRNSVGRGTGDETAALAQGRRRGTDRNREYRAYRKPRDRRAHQHYGHLTY